jgi:hypothetical protein
MSILLQLPSEQHACSAHVQYIAFAINHLAPEEFRIFAGHCNWYPVPKTECGSQSILMTLTAYQGLCVTY